MNEYFVLIIGMLFGGILGIVFGKYFKLLFSWILFKLNIR
jgi:hypothetical protein